MAGQAIGGGDQEVAGAGSGIDDLDIQQRFFGVFAWRLPRSRSATTGSRAVSSRLLMSEVGV
jgi:hypothetical protein